MWLIGLRASLGPCRSLESVADSANGAPRHRKINLTGGAGSQGCRCVIR